MLKKLYNQYSSHKKFKQVSALLFVNIFSIPLGIITSIIITRYLGSNVYGDFMFISNIFNLAVILGTFGIFQAGNRALVINNDEENAREYYGAELIYLISIFLVISFALVIYAFLDKNLEIKGLKSIFLFLVPFSWIFIFVNYFEVLFQADNKIELLAQSRLVPKIGFFLFSLVLFMIGESNQVKNHMIVWVGFISTQLLVYIYVIKKINPSFNNLKSRIKEIWVYNKTYGFDVYLGSVFAVGFTQLSGILISYFSENNSSVGFFSLAVSFSAPLALIPNIIATTHYKDFSTQNKIPTKLTIITIFISLLALFFIWIIVTPFILTFYGKEFESVINLNFIVSIGVIFHGMADFVNRFLGAHGQGKSLRNSSFILGISLLICNITLIPLLNETGAALTRLITGIFYIILMVFYYVRLKNKLKINSAL